MVWAPFGIPFTTTTHDTVKQSIITDNQLTDLYLNKKTLHVRLISPPTAQFHTTSAGRSNDSDTMENVAAQLPPGVKDLPNLGVSVLVITLPPTNSTLVVAVEFSPVWDSAGVVNKGLQHRDNHTDRTPGIHEHHPLVLLEDWTLDSHSTLSSLRSKVVATEGTPLGEMAKSIQ